MPQVYAIKIRNILMQYLKRENSKFEEQNLKLKKKKKDNIDPVLATP